MDAHPIIKMISIVVAVVLTVIGVTYGVSNWKKVQPLQNKSSSRLDTVTQSVAKGDLIQYDDQHGAVTVTVPGSDVRSCINTESSPSITVTVKTLANATGKSYNGPTYNIEDRGNVDYITPTSQFESVLNYSTNNEVIGITFTQKK